MTTTPAQPAHGSERPAVLGDSALQSQTLESVASAVNYHDWLTSLTRPHLGDHPVELGSGLGDYAQRWLDLGVPQVTVTEADPGRLAGLHERFADDGRVHVTTLDLSSPEPADHSAFVMVNVLEHIPDDVQALRAAHSLVRPGGAVVVLVPAFSFAMSRFDRAVGHVRRYTVGSLTRAMTEAGLEVEDARYVNLPGLPVWFLGMRLLRMTPGEGRFLSVWDNQVVPRARRWEEKHRPPFGQSVLAVARVGTR
jgi:SAM-dependent methyltransferase